MIRPHYFSILTIYSAKVKREVQKHSYSEHDEHEGHICCRIGVKGIAWIAGRNLSNDFPLLSGEIPYILKTDNSGKEEYER